MDYEIERNSKSHQKYPFVSIIIPSYDGYNLTDNTLFSLKKTVDYPNYQITVIDNGSHDSTTEKLKNSHPYVKVIRNPRNIGFPKVINQGIISFPADFYFILSNDVILINKNWLSILIKEMKKDPRIGIISGKIINIFNKNFEKENYDQFVNTYLKDIREDKIHYKKNIDASAILVRDIAIKSVGLLNEEFTPGYYEDTDWCARMLKGGWKLAEVQNIRFLHAPTTTTKRIYSKEFFYFYLFARNRAIFFRKHPTFSRLYEQLYVIFKSLFHIFLKDSFKIKRKKLWYFYHAYLYNIKMIWMKFLKILKK